ncbi:hypothetical protein EYB53_024600 [Candidatus Chloroploca sp. M-50]|uniref:Type II secretion system protein GspF domain-containing protein n=1 Tax=Candidatus Chloroploca mongolica TaxID=2528176 RepID=A0ABS4DHJ6_9CHLR|nr:hypothetical protein [Candidatus Chloroploca mongolica]MBP1468912.1 hypothetical protein [Candidatus Chloroploca mongolica]
MLGGGEILIILLNLLIPALVIGLILFPLFRLMALAQKRLLPLQRVEALLRQREQSPGTTVIVTARGQPGNGPTRPGLAVAAPLQSTSNMTEHVAQASVYPVTFALCYWGFCKTPMISSFPIHPGVSAVLALTAVLLGLLALAWEPARALVRSPAPMARRSAPDGKQRAANSVPDPFRFTPALLDQCLLSSVMIATGAVQQRHDHQVVSLIDVSLADLPELAQAIDQMIETAIQDVRAALHAGDPERAQVLISTPLANVMVQLQLLLLQCFLLGLPWAIDNIGYG